LLLRDQPYQDIGEVITLDQLAHAVHVREIRDAEAAEVVRKIFT